MAHLPGYLVEAVAAVEQDDPGQAPVVWLSAAAAAGLRLYPDVGAVLREAVPTAATAAQLLAAGARRTTNTRTCEDCGAHPETPCTLAADGRALCGTCAHITRLRTRQAEARAAAQDVAETAYRLLADEHLAVLQIDYTPGEPTAAGTPRPPAAARLTAIDRTGTDLYDRTVRLTGPRTPRRP
ncbi:hypothetical protein [Kitasatospora sp. NPDC057500]|uniref:hypothetical protein n=1 Tax=Kitasatospora sp. NPDC057500 TaxID=3346151 RepID=UPI003681E6F0